MLHHDYIRKQADLHPEFAKLSDMKFLIVCSCSHWLCGAVLHDHSQSLHCFQEIKFMECDGIFVAKVKPLKWCITLSHGVFNRSPHGADLHAVMPCVAVTLHFFCVTLFIVFLAEACMVPNCTQKYLCVAVASFLLQTPCILLSDVGLLLATVSVNCIHFHISGITVWCCLLESFLRITAFTFKMWFSCILGISVRHKIGATVMCSDFMRWVYVATCFMMFHIDLHSSFKKLVFLNSKIWQCI